MVWTEKRKTRRGDELWARRDQANLRHYLFRDKFAPISPCPRRFRPANYSGTN